MNKISKAVIPCGGMGTRFLPITKAIPKEILPIIDTPVLSYIVNEAIDSGITDIMIVLGQGKDAIKNYFMPNSRLEDALYEAGKTEILKLVKDIHQKANFTFATQEVPRGSGDAVLYAEKFTGKEAFALAWGDDLICSDKPVMGQLTECYYNEGASVLGVQEWLGDDIVKYGVAQIEKGYKTAAGEVCSRSYKCLSIVEKPPLDKLPSRLACLGRYILTPAIFDEIRRTPLGKNNELQLTDSLNALCKTEGIFAYDFIGKRYDMGDKFGATQAVVEFALKNADFGGDFKSYLKELVSKL